MSGQAAGAVDDLRAPVAVLVNQLVRKNRLGQFSPSLPLPSPGETTLNELTNRPESLNDASWEDFSHWSFLSRQHLGDPVNGPPFSTAGPEGRGRPASEVHRRRGDATFGACGSSLPDLLLPGRRLLPGMPSLLRCFQPRRQR